MLANADGGKEACAVVLDTDGAFSVPRLAAQLRFMISKRHEQLPVQTIEDVVHTALKHVHIFRPASLASAIATLDMLTTYLFDENRHHSLHRPVAFIAMDSTSAFYWQDRAEREDVGFVAALSKSTYKSAMQPSGYTELATAITAACEVLKCPSLITNWETGSTMSADGHDSSAHAIRPLIHGPWSRLPTLRLIVRRLPIRKLPPGICVEEALREADERRKAVEEGRFECRINEWGLTAGMLQELRSAGGGGFNFTVTSDGVQVDS